MQPQSQRVAAIWWIALAAFLARAAYILLLHTYRVPAADPFAFGMESGSIARSLAAGEGFASPFRAATGPTAWVAPVYPLLCALAFKLFGIYSQAAALAVLMMNSAFSALTAVALYYLGRSTAGERVALAAAAVWALAPPFMKWAAEWAWDMSLSALLATLLLLVALQLEQQSTTRRWTWFGILAGAVALTNPALLTLVPWIALWLAWRLQRRSARGLALAALLAAAMVAPWLLRNRMVLGEWVFVRDNFGFEFHLGNYHNSNGMGWRGLHPTVNPREFDQYVALGELKYIAAAQREAFAFVREYPAEFAGLSWVRARAFWDGTCLYYALQPRPWTPALYGAFSALGLLGLVFATTQRMPGSGLFWWIALYPAPYYLTYPQPRYRHAVEPVLLLLATWLVAEVVSGMRNRSRARALAAAAR